MLLFPTEIHVGVDECYTAGNWTERRRTVVQTRERSTDAGFRRHRERVLPRVSLFLRASFFLKMVKLKVLHQVRLNHFFERW